MAAPTVLLVLASGSVRENRPSRRAASQAVPVRTGRSGRVAPGVAQAAGAVWFEGVRRAVVQG